MAQITSPCGWVPDAPCTSGPCCPDTTDPIIKARAESIASSILWRLTGLQFGCCELTVRPCKPLTCDPLTLSQIIYWDQRYLDGRAGNLGVLSYFPTLVDGAVFNIACGCPVGCCKCRADCEVKLPGPVCAVDNVTMDGIVQGAGLYTLYDNSTLAFLGGATIVVPMSSATEIFPGAFSAGPYGFISGSGMAMVTDGFGQTGLSMPQAGQQYCITGPQLDVGYEIALPQFSGGINFNVILGPPNTFEVTVLAGDMTVTVVGNNVAVSAPGYGVAGRILVRSTQAPSQSNTPQCIENVDGSAMLLTAIQYVDPSLDGVCPPCQDYNKPLGAAGTWSVTYSVGTPVPGELNFAAGLYACQIALAMVDSKACTLPARVASVTRQGMTESFWDPIMLTEAGLTGLPLVDQIVRAINPYGMRQSSRVWYPGMQVTRQQTP